MQKSAEDYLETILILERQKGNHVHSVDIAHELDFSKPSVSVAMKNLRSSGHIVVDNEGHITLTENGRKIAQSIYDRHTIISDWLISLGVEKEIAISDACKIEHDISEQSFKAIRKHINKWKKQ
ncbi:MAG: metal-dependent transcriptional regulator [Treponema sp.]|jgi:Mn-dependent DtxR family transcriptional regulator|nr:metal-dependent transcriptional regulator [Treponema sp.]